MKRTLLWLLFALSTAVQGATLDGGIYPPELKPVPEEAHAAHLAAELLARIAGAGTIRSLHRSRRGTGFEGQRAGELTFTKTRGSRRHLLES